MWLELGSETFWALRVSKEFLSSGLFTESQQSETLCTRRVSGVKLCVYLTDRVPGGRERGEVAGKRVREGKGKGKGREREGKSKGRGMYGVE